MRREIKEVLVYTAENSAMAKMLVEKLKQMKIPARLGVESAAAGVFGISEGSRTILVPEEFAQRARKALLK
ncbi:MAG: hypothetical protein A2134_00860 [Candidatus Woykebacteria bacterium RBG_16_39_9b]|uniref:Uncharacterized protein n=1 Tax=Candidatus Woykebacteria bacterium RBG_16_39_9b TaxID=1802595 RepID=A0A1G1WEL0_9BACT|nr:MAG: hypothetical protein A2134_00860 [Candidatus Woykebacteria bacterium RBG_16_39_9b]